VKEEKNLKIDMLLKSSEKMTTAEMSEYISERFADDFELFKCLIVKQKERYDSIRSDEDIKQLIVKVRGFYDDLIEDGYLKKDPFMFEKKNLDGDKLRQVRYEATTLVNGNLWVEAIKNYKMFFIQANRAYTLYYESLIETYLSPLAQKLGTKSGKKTIILQKVIEYKNGKHAETFRSLIPLVRNSIQHADYVINRKKPEITFYDEKKLPLTVNLLEFQTIFSEIWLLTLSFDIVTWDIEYPFNKYAIEELEVVQNFLRTQKVKLVKSDKSLLSLLDWAALIKSAKMQ